LSILEHAALVELVEFPLGMSSEWTRSHEGHSMPILALVVVGFGMWKTCRQGVGQHRQQAAEEVRRECRRELFAISRGA